MKKISLFFYLVTLVLINSLSHATYFYLSTEKSFMESENAKIKIESHSTPYVDIRVYKIPDPEAFIKSKKNINRVFVESEYIKKTLQNFSSDTLIYLNLLSEIMAVRKYLMKKQGKMRQDYIVTF